MTLEVASVTKVFDIPGTDGVRRLEVLDEFSFEHREGDFVALLGPSGCGKSTLLRIIDGLTPPTSGTVRLNGRTLTKPGPDRAMVFQGHDLLPWRTVTRNVEFGLEMLGISKAERRSRALEMLDLVGLTDFADFYPAQLSGGMAQRVGLARALVMDPELLLMDEPFGALDALTRIVLQRELERILSASRRSVLFVTHDLEEAIFLGDRVLVLSSRPARIIEDVRVPFDRPRDQGLRGDSHFAELKAHVWNVLQGGREPPENKVTPS
jgi:NitT/TauT family transport system ATP-binding protein